MRMQFIISGLALVLASLHISAIAQEYTIKQTKPNVGTLLRRDIVKAGTIPLDKKYGELTPEQQKALKAQYEHMGDQDEPPFPADGLLPAYKAVALAHEKFDLRHKGTLVLYVDVDSDGKAKGVSVETSPDPDISKEVGMFLMVQKYKPAMCKGVPCAQVFPLRAELVGPEGSDMATGNRPPPGVMITPHSP